MMPIPETFRSLGANQVYFVALSTAYLGCSFLNTAKKTFKLIHLFSASKILWLLSPFQIYFVLYGFMSLKKGLLM